MKMKNKALAIPAAAEATPPKPNAAATKAMIKKIRAQRNIILSLNMKLNLFKQ